jgi:glycosyltransferase involved in cell wall biosynthesis
VHAVILIDHAHVNGGQAKVAIDSALGLAARGHRVTFLAAVGPVDPRLGKAGVEVVCLDQDDIETATSKLAFAAQVMWNTRAARALGDLLRGCDPADTVVHVQGWAKALSPSIGPVIARSGLPAVYTMHEFFLVCPNGGFYDYPAGAICRRTPMSLACVTRNCDARSYPRKAMRLMRHATLALPHSLRNAIRDVILISDLQQSVSAPYFPPQTVFHRVDNPISAPDLGPKAGGEGLGDAIFIGRLSTEKGAPIFAEAARQAGVRAVFVGAGPSEAELRARYPEAAFLGWKSPEEVRALMRQARALVFPSVWYEGQPLTVYEALAVGTPVVVSDACAGREAVTEGENGFWFRSGDPASLAAHLKALADGGVARRMSAAAHARYWAAPLTMDRHLDRLLGVYAAVLRDALPAAPRPAEAALAGVRAAASMDS